MGSPSAEGSLVKLLLDSGYDVFRVTLKGHAGPPAEMGEASASIWLADAYTQYSAAYTEAEKRKMPLYLCAFSLGALVFEDLMNEETKTPVRFEKAVLFAPAIALRARARALLLADPFVKDSAIINSVSPVEYRAQRGASLAAYKAIFELEKRLERFQFAHNNIETLLFIDPSDELISPGGIQKYISRFALTVWRVIKISNAGAKLKPRYHHLIIDSNCVSAETWDFIASNTLNHLSGIPQ
jgi:alpha-beta hydrolase superfamily lysophospholipase